MLYPINFLSVGIRIMMTQSLIKENHFYEKQLKSLLEEEIKMQLEGRYMLLEVVLSIQEIKVRLEL